MKDVKIKFQFVSKDISKDPGCYLFFDKNDKLLYVGKAKNLRKRVSSYFQKTKKSPKTEKLVKTIFKIETRIVHSEMEALLLENNLIKEFRPKYNILLRDDKNFLYLRITNEVFPRIETTRKIVRDGSIYIGPKTSATKFRNTIQFCQKIFRIRTCRLDMNIGSSCKNRCKHDKMSSKKMAESLDKNQTDGRGLSTNIKITSNPEKRKIPCLDYHIKKCAAPCVAHISPEEYQKDVDSMRQFLQGNTKNVISGLQAKMLGFAEDKNFEAAAKIRDLIQSIEVSTEKQSVQLDDNIDRDFIHFSRKDYGLFFVRIVFRNGRFLDQNEMEFQCEGDSTDEEIIQQFCIQFYEKVDSPPREICVPIDILNDSEIVNFLSSTYFNNVKIDIKNPKKGVKKSVMDMAQKNAANYAAKMEIEWMHKKEDKNAVPELANILNLMNPLRRMECYDISHLGGAHTVASQVVFMDGQPKKSEYRRYKVKTLPDGKIDDFASMEEILTRRFAKIEIGSDSKDGQNPKDRDSQKTSDNRIRALEKIPDLVIIDGGQGQLSSVMKAVKKFKFPGTFDPQVQIIALAKKEELIYRPGSSEPIFISHDSPALKLLQRIRDEAHRFAISFNRSLRDKSLVKSVLDEVSGIGPSSKKRLLKVFGSVAGIRKASDEELMKVISAKQLDNIRKVI